jgi:hypothetical protein
VQFLLKYWSGELHPLQWFLSLRNALQMAQSMPQGAMRDALNGFFATMHGIMLWACKKLPCITFTTSPLPVYMRAAATTMIAGKRE